ncbi:DUF4145 domain-containing protein [Rhizobium leguminosarum]|uniref:DUF4145 domain-containing protein n=1 Tax=Rhizobium leguminosarum TaxID=384 RepID=UPI001C97628A|nr:DUF4145 domain-containing protein [Rhizobium leguminosarum]MBY5594131.1 DUF4145 domain-containing protein [Rhizobium leguminosarum]
MENYWRSTYSSFPKFLCPRCEAGRLISNDGNLKFVETGFSLNEHSHLAWEPEWITERFACFLVCDRPSCGEVVAVSGDTSHFHHEEYDEDLGEEVQYHGRRYSPTAMHPAPHIIKVSKKLDAVCRGDLEASFALLWVDPAACANRLRTFIEHLLDQFKIERIGINKKDEEYTLNLVQRIDKLEKLKPGHDKTIKALKRVGDYGTHQGKAKFDTLLKCYELLEAALADIVDGKKAHLDKLIAELMGNDDDF